MDAEQKVRNRVSYIFSKEVILKDLLRQGILQDREFERYDEMLYDRYQLDADTGIPRPTVQTTPGQLEIPPVGGEVAYISLTAEAKKVFENGPGYAVQSWLRDGNTIAFLHYWELKNNPNFNASGYERLLEELKSPSSTLTAKNGLRVQVPSVCNPSRGKRRDIRTSGDCLCFLRLVASEFSIFTDPVVFSGT